MRFFPSHNVKVGMFLCCIFPFFAHVQAETGASCTSMTATGNSEYPPFLWIEGENSNDLLGANRLIIDEISRRLGIPIKLMHTGPWSRAQLEVKSGRVDLMAGAFYTNARSDYMDYLWPAFLRTSSVVWKRTGQKLKYKKKEDLIDKRGVTVINNSFGQKFDDFAEKNLDIIFVSGLEQAFKMLIARRVDYAIYEKSPGIAYLNLLDMSADVVSLSPISSEGLYLTLSKGSSCNTPLMRQNLNNVLKEMSRDGFNDKALEQSLVDWNAFSKNA
ncbi:substrate-binding periplasmic protein [Marinomonas sp. 2405UD68-3]|uniref:substrate-binding periplasmic protein n=1 Tax=Marinomonas sp. 2405UD68-3 TaxID=3391835 RepID=UPI0039C9EB67